MGTRHLEEQCGTLLNLKVISDVCKPALGSAGRRDGQFQQPRRAPELRAGRAETPKGLALPLTLSGNRLQQQRFTDLGSVFPDVHSDW